jgi:hypothetical protein
LMMPRYYFDVDGLPPAMDAVEEDLRDDEHAWREATVFAGQMFKDVDGRLEPGQDWRLIVSDAGRNPVFVFEVKSQKVK